MRALMIIAVTLFGIAAATAADLPAEREHNVFTHHVPYGQRVGPIVIYDFEPGVVVRAYWLSPWRHRHYFPFGAQQDTDAAPGDDGPPQPAENFERYWSTSQTFIREQPPQPLRARDEAPSDQRQQLAPVPEK